MLKDNNYRIVVHFLRINTQGIVETVRAPSAN